MNNYLLNSFNFRKWFGILIKNIPENKIHMKTLFF